MFRQLIGFSLALCGLFSAMDARLIVQGVDTSAPSDFLKIIDPHHYQMLGLGIYSQSDAYSLDLEAIDHFRNTFGIDFCLSNPDVSYEKDLDMRTFQDIAVMVPLLIGNDGHYRVLYDSDNLDKTSETWTVRSPNIIVQFLQDGVFTSGTAAGQAYHAGDVITYGYTDHLKKETDWTLPENREHFTLFSLCTGNQPMNGYGIPEVHVLLHYIDSLGNAGYATDNTYREVIDAEDAVIRRITHHVIQF